MLKVMREMDTWHDSMVHAGIVKESGFTPLPTPQLPPGSSLRTDGTVIRNGKPIGKYVPKAESGLENAKYRIPLNNPEEFNLSPGDYDMAVTKDRRIIYNRGTNDVAKDNEGYTFETDIPRKHLDARQRNRMRENLAASRFQDIPDVVERGINVDYHEDAYNKNDPAPIRLRNPEGYGNFVMPSIGTYNPKTNEVYRNLPSGNVTVGPDGTVTSIDANGNASNIGTFDKKRGFMPMPAPYVQEANSPAPPVASSISGNAESPRSSAVQQAQPTSGPASNPVPVTKPLLPSPPPVKNPVYSSPIISKPQNGAPSMPTTLRKSGTLIASAGYAPPALGQLPPGSSLQTDGTVIRNGKPIGTYTPKAVPQQYPSALQQAKRVGQAVAEPVVNAARRFNNSPIGQSEAMNQVKSMVREDIVNPIRDAGRGIYNFFGGHKPASAPAQPVPQTPAPNALQKASMLKASEVKEEIFPAIMSEYPFRKVADLDPVNEMATRPKGPVPQNAHAEMIANGTAKVIPTDKVPVRAPVPNPAPAPAQNLAPAQNPAPAPVPNPAPAARPATAGAPARGPVPTSTPAAGTAPTGASTSGTAPTGASTSGTAPTSTPAAGTAPTSAPAAGTAPTGASTSGTAPTSTPASAGTTAPADTTAPKTYTGSYADPDSMETTYPGLTRGADGRYYDADGTMMAWPSSTEDGKIFVRGDYSEPEATGELSTTGEGTAAPVDDGSVSADAPAPEDPTPPPSDAQSPFNDPNVRKYMLMGLPIGAALGLAGYMMGGSKEGTLLPMLLAGAGGGALLGGLGGHYGWFGKGRQEEEKKDSVDSLPFAEPVKEEIAKVTQEAPLVQKPDGTIAPPTQVVLDPGGSDPAITSDDMMSTYRGNLKGKDVRQVREYLSDLHDKEKKKQVTPGTAKALGLEYLNSYSERPQGTLAEGGDGIHATTTADLHRWGQTPNQHAESYWVPQRLLQNIPSDFWHSGFDPADYPNGVVVYKTGDGRWKTSVPWGRDVTWNGFQQILDDPKNHAGNTSHAHSLLSEYNDLTDLVRSW